MANYFIHFLIALPDTPYFLPVPSYPKSLISFNNKFIAGLSTFLNEILEHLTHCFDFVVFSLPHLQ